jgi:hypothetical protein
MRGVKRTSRLSFFAPVASFEVNWDGNEEAVH